MVIENQMQEVSVKELIGKYNLIVPEIQREYVWGMNDYNILDSFFQDIKNGFNDKKTDNQSEIDEIQKLINKSTDEKSKLKFSKILAEIESSNNAINIGFLYSYRPDYYVFNDRNEDVYLIDGQQRFTTLFFTLYYFALKENRLIEFLSMFRFNQQTEHIAFDYRVRTITHNFVIDLLSNIKSLKELDDIILKNWFLKNYHNDVTIKSIVGDEKKTNGVFNKLVENFKTDSNQYFDYVANEIKFWHFKTEETTQGEELYITMNSRGQQLADNENIRAKLFDSELVKNDPLRWSEKWEIWQDFFWKHRNKKEPTITADEGFNEFLRWVQIIKMIEKQSNAIETDDEDDINNKEIIDIIKWGKERKLSVEFFDLAEIDTFFESLKYLFETFPTLISSFSSNYSNYNQFNLLELGWLSPIDNNNSILQKESYRLLPILFYCKKIIESNAQQDPLKLFRVIRFFYNTHRLPNIEKSANIQLINAIKIISKLNTNADITEILTLKEVSNTILNEEEKTKLILMRSSNKRFDMENSFWIAEDHFKNEGEILHLLKLSYINEIFDLTRFNSVYSVFDNLIKNEDLIWGNLISTKVYTVFTDRIAFNEDSWYKNEGFLNLILSRLKFIKLKLEEFLIHEQKTFIKKYKTEDDVINESDLKKQIYIYYIIMSNIDKNWQWMNNSFNFCIYTSYSPYKSLFNTKYIYQLYRSRSYESDNKILYIQKKLPNKSKLINNIFSWAHS